MSDGTYGSDFPLPPAADGLAPRPAAPRARASASALQQPPKLTEIPAFTAYMGMQWDTPDRTPTAVPGAVEAAAAHRAGLAAVGPGHRFTDFHHAVMEVIAHGLDDWDLLPVSVDEALSDAGQHHRRYLICGIGHHLGLDVHDCAQAAPEAYQGATMGEGMVLTVEPGLYFHAHDLTVPPELRGIGVRIEDGILVTSGGSEVLSRALPLDADGLEQWTAGR